MSNIPRPKLIKIVESGPQGPRGIIGPAGPTGSFPPFFQFHNSLKFYTTSSISFFSSISSSIIPYTGSNSVTTFSLGSETSAWNKIYVGTNSIKFVSSSNTISELNANKNSIYIGISEITTESFGFLNDPIIFKQNDIINISLTGSFSMQSTPSTNFKVQNNLKQNSFIIDNESRIILYNFIDLPTPVTGSIIYSSGHFFLGY